MKIEVPMPQMGESIAEGTLVKWHKNVGDRVRRDETLFEISTDKVDTEVPSPQDGFIAAILVKEGETVPVHTTVCVLGTTPDDGQPAGAATTLPGGPSPQAAPSQTPQRTGPEGKPRPADGSEAPARDLESRLREKSSPLVRRLAAEHGIDLSAIRGTGLSGRVTKEDIEQIIAQKLAAPAAATPGGDRIEPMSILRQRIAEHMVLSRRTSAHVSSVFEVDMTAARAFKDNLLSRRENDAGVKITYLPFVLQAVGRGLRKFPALNASIEGKNVRYHSGIHIGVAVALDDGLIVPVIRDADKRGTVALARAIGDLSQRARTKKLNPEEVQGGTFTVTNPGVFGSLIGTPIINQPQVAILCLGAVTRRPVVLPGADAIVVRSMAYLSLTFDHRLIDGSVADRFMAEVKSHLEKGSFEE